MLENKLGLTSSAELAREEERISKKKGGNAFLKITFLTTLKAESFQHYRQSTSTFLTKSTILRES